jgi:hypothetical protein
MKTITIYADTERNMYFVLVGDRFADRLTFDEALGLVATELMTKTPRPPTWLKTGDEWREGARASGVRAAEAQLGVDLKDYAANGERQDELRTVEVPVVDSTKLGVPTREIDGQTGDNIHGIAEQLKRTTPSPRAQAMVASILAPESVEDLVDDDARRRMQQAQAWPDGVMIYEQLRALYGTRVWSVTNGTTQHLLVAKRPNSADPGFDWLAPGEQRLYASDAPSFVATHPFKPEDRL